MIRRFAGGSLAPAVQTSKSPTQDNYQNLFWNNHLPSNDSRQQKKQLNKVKANKSPLRFSFDAQRQLLKWDARCWQGRTIVGMSWSGCGGGPAALSLALGCSCRQGHMPEGELATLLPVPPGACLKPLPIVLILVHHILLIIQNNNSFFKKLFAPSFLLFSLIN